ncbi:MAG: type IV toxin-antitoxin system AbiEi family antitoxin domain-containing protein, partial [Pseudomonadales bacterium]
MTVHIKNKLNHLERALPEGLLVDAPWLERSGYYRSLRSHYVAAGWLEQPARSVFRRPRGTVGWEQTVISLQTLLKYPVSVGGRTALELQGYAHYLPQSQKTIHLYGDKKLPSWVNKLKIEQSFVFHNRLRLLPKVDLSTSTTSLFDLSIPGRETNLQGGLRITPWGQWLWPLIISTPERAILELLDELPKYETFHLADVTMEGLVNLSPRRQQALLEETKSVKVKRLFFFFAERHQHRWLKHINRDKIDLGKGKRMLIKGGKLDPTYQITVPLD